MTEKQKKLYKHVKRTKRSESFLTDEEKAKSKELSFIDKLFNLLIKNKLTSNGIMQLCLLEDKKYSSINASLNRMLKDMGETKTVKDFLQQPSNKGFHNKIQDEINNILPDF